MTAYDGLQITLERDGKTFCIKVGEEIEVERSEREASTGGYCRTYCNVKLIGTRLVYKGGWRPSGNTIMQKLAGPLGNGTVLYPNGDRFQGFFHLSYACIGGPAYAADGRYDFADGSYIERAWINTSDNHQPECWGLNGVFRIHHPEEYDSVAMFLHGGKRYGFELCLPKDSCEKPWVREWFAGDLVIRYLKPDKLFRYEIVDYEIDETSKKDCTTLRLTISDGNIIYRIEQQGGRYEANQYDNYIYHPYTHVIIYLPNGDIMEHRGSSVRDFKAYDGYVDMYCAKTGKSRTEHWEKGLLTDNQEWKYDKRGSISVELPNPTGANGKMEANVWTDGHIEYKYKEWVYDGEVKNNCPNGKGVLVAGRLHNNRRYEGLFADGVFISDEKHLDGEITLHVKSGHCGGSGGWKYEERDIVARRGTLNIQGFWNYEITGVRHDSVTIEFYEEKYYVRPEEPLRLYKEIEGREWSDGCVYDSDDYSLELTWKG